MEFRSPHVFPFGRVGHEYICTLVFWDCLILLRSSWTEMSRFQGASFFRDLLVHVGVFLSLASYKVTVAYCSPFAVLPLCVFSAACRYVLLPASPFSIQFVKGGSFISLTGSSGEYYAFPPWEEGEGQAQLGLCSSAR